MSRRQSGRTDFDDWDMPDDFREKEPEKPPVVPRSDFDEEWAEYTREERMAAHRKPRRKNTNNRSGNGGRKLLLGIVALAAIAALVIGVVYLNAEEKPQLWGGGSDSTHSTESGESNPTRNTVPTGQTDAPDDDPTTVPTVETQPTEPPAEPVECRYHGRQLNNAEKTAYEMLVRGMLAQETEIANIYLPDHDSVKRVMNAVFNDYAEILWYNGGYSTSYYEKDGYLDLTIIPQYEGTPGERAQWKKEIDSKIQGLLNALDGKSEYEKVKGVYEFLIDNTAYDYDYPGYSVHQILTKGRAVCAGYARAMQYILTELDVETIYVSGEAGSPGDTESHAWNIVKIDGAYYQIDATWGDPYYEDGTQTKNFNYFCLTDEEMGRDHWPEKQGYPPCTSTKYNYFRYEGRFLESYDTELLKVWIQEADASGEPLYFKMANAQLYQEVEKKLITDGGIFTLMEEAIGEAKGYSWSPAEKLYILLISW